MWRFVRGAPNLSTADYHSLMSAAACVSVAPPGSSTTPFLLLGFVRPRVAGDRRCAVNWETHTSVIKAAGGLYTAAASFKAALLS